MPTEEANLPCTACLASGGDERMEGTTENIYSRSISTEVIISPLFLLMFNNTELIFTGDTGE